MRSFFILERIASQNEVEAEVVLDGGHALVVTHTVLVRSVGITHEIEETLVMVNQWLYFHHIVDPDDGGTDE